MLNSDLHNNRTALIILASITVLNIALAINFLVPGISDAALGLSSLQLYALIGLEVIAVMGCYSVIKRNTKALTF